MTKKSVEFVTSSRVISHTQCLRSLIKIEKKLLNFIANVFLKRAESRSLGSPQAYSL